MTRRRGGAEKAVLLTQRHRDTERFVTIQVFSLRLRVKCYSSFPRGRTSLCMLDLETGDEWRAKLPLSYSFNPNYGVSFSTLLQRLRPFWACWSFFRFFH